MILTGDYHTHTPYSHGKNTVLENAERAKSVGLKEIGIADHGFSHIMYGLRRKEVASYRKECAEAEEKTGVKVLGGLEANIRSLDGLSDLTEKDYENFDLYLCGHHVYVFYDTPFTRWTFGYGNWMQKQKRTDKRVARNTRAYINVIKNNPLDAITHLNYLCVSDAVEVAKCAADYGTYIELNSKKAHLTDEELADIVAKTSARFIVNSDAHAAVRVGDTALVDEQLKRIGFPMDRIDNIDGRFPTFRFAEFKKRL